MRGLERGSMMAGARTLLSLGRSRHRSLSVRHVRGHARAHRQGRSVDRRRGKRPARARAALRRVASMGRGDPGSSAGSAEVVSYLARKIHFVKGKVQDTIPHHAPDQIALLRPTPTGMRQRSTNWFISILGLPPEASSSSTITACGVVSLRAEASWRATEVASGAVSGLVIRPGVNLGRNGSATIALALPTPIRDLSANPKPSKLSSGVNVDQRLDISSTTISGR